MKLDDPRHGTSAGAVQHWKDRETPCDPCALAAYRESKQRKLERSRGLSRSVPAIGYQRRSQALHALGYSHSQVSALMGVGQGTHSNRMRATWVNRANHDRMCELFERLSMTPNPKPDLRTLRNAARRGYLPPLAWDDIDDPDERPATRIKGRRDVLAEYVHLTSLGESHEQAIKALGVTDKAIEKAQTRARKAA